MKDDSLGQGRATAELEDSEDIGVNDSTEPPIGELIARRLSRRSVLKGIGAGVAIGPLVETLLDSAAAAQGAGPSTLSFQEIGQTLDDKHHLPEGYDAQVLIRWGDPILPGGPAYDPNALTAAAQEKQFGYNCDFVGYFPLPQGSNSSEHGLLTVNHEYTNTGLMFAGMPERSPARSSTKAQAEVELAAHGMSFVEIRRQGGRWAVVADGKLNRRLTMNTPMRLSGPAAAHELVKTNADPSGTRVLGTLNNCAGGTTPWGTVLTGEENINFYFGGGDPDKSPSAAMYRRYGITKDSARYSWPKHFDRFNLEKEPNEPNRFGWVVETDPYDPDAVPVKRTALGRFKHEGCTCALAKDGRVAFYSGDDERFEYVYKFVTSRPWNPNDRAANRDLMDEGILYVAQFADDGAVKWLPLVHGQGPLTAENGFRDQGEVLIYAREAAKRLKATPMDRPEDVETNPENGKVYVVLTKNDRRKPEQVDRANPRANNIHGHIIEITPKDGDHAAAEATWSIFVAGGRPGLDEGAVYHRAVSEKGWLSCPDNVAFDSKGRIWISTDGASDAAGIADGLWAADCDGYGRALTRLFFQAPIGAEVCGPTLTPDDQTLFLAIQHPAQEAGSTFEKPATRWPDFKEGVPPRPSVLAITKKGGGSIGS